MSISPIHVLEQGPVLASLVQAAVSGLRPRPDSTQVPGPVFTATVRPRSAGLINNYIRHVGGNPKSYRGAVPAHLFPQWGFPMLSKTLGTVPYDLTKVLNGGCRLEMHHKLPANKPLQLQSSLLNIDDNGKRAVLEQQLITGTASSPCALTATVYGIVPLKRSKKGGPRKPKPSVPHSARPIDQWRLKPIAGREFAYLTGDFNPIHWITPAARAAGFKNPILHGFSTMARAIESLNNTVFSGDVNRLQTVDVKFTRPLVLPAKPTVFLDGNEFFVGHHPGGLAYMTGTFTVVE